MQRKRVVRWFNHARRFGFLGCQGGPDVFVYYSSIQHDGYKKPKEGEAISFDVIEGEKGLPANAEHSAIAQGDHDNE